MLLKLLKTDPSIASWHATTLWNVFQITVGIISELDEVFRFYALRMRLNGRKHTTLGNHFLIAMR